MAHELVHVIRQSESGSNFIQRSVASDIIDKHTDWGFLDEEELGIELANSVKQGTYSIVKEVLNELGSTDRDDVSYQIMRNLGNSVLERVIETGSGENLLDRLFNELESGPTFSDEQAQADRIHLTKLNKAERESAIPTEDMSLEEREEEESAIPTEKSADSNAISLIDKYTSWYGNLDEQALAVSLVNRVKQGNYLIVMNVLDELGSTDRDDVSYEFMRNTSDSSLAMILQSREGSNLLTRIFDELTSGSAGEEETFQSDRILNIKEQSTNIEEFPSTPETLKIFPFLLSYFDNAPIFAERRSGGLIHVKIPFRVMTSSTYSDEIKTLPTDVFISGIEIPETEYVGIRMYDFGGELVVKPALYLVQLGNETVTDTYKKIGEITLETGLTAISGGASVAGRAVLGSTKLARGLMWVDRAASLLGAITFIIRENRGWIISEYGNDGKVFLDHVNLVNSAVSIYGIGRLGSSGGKMIFDGFKSKYKHWKVITSKNIDRLDDGQKNAIRGINENSEELISSVEDAKKIEAESQGAGLLEGEEVIDPFSGETLGYRSATARTPRSQWTAIRADIGEAEAYKLALKRGEIGLKRAFKANAPGIDFITAARVNGQMRIIVTDVKTTTVGRFSYRRKTSLPTVWRQETRAALSDANIANLDPTIQQRLRLIRDDPNIDQYIDIRYIEVDYSPTGGGTIQGL